MAEFGGSVPRGGRNPWPERHQRGYTQLRLVAYDRSGAVVGETETVMGRASFEIYGFLFFAIRRNDIYPGERFQITVD